MNVSRAFAEPARRRVLLTLAQIALAAMSYVGAFLLSYDFTLPATAFVLCLQTIPVLIIVRLILAYKFRVDRGYWQHVGLRDLVQLTAAIVTGSVVFPITLLIMHRLAGIPVSVFVLDALLLLVLAGGVRATARVFRERHHLGIESQGRRTFIVGAGEAGEQLLRQIQHDHRMLFNVVGLIDDDAAKRDRTLHGVPVVGRTDELRGLVALHHVVQALIAVPSAAPATLRKIVDRCVDAGIEVKLLPPLQNQVTGDAKLSQIRDVQIEDLLGREPVQLDNSTAAPDLTGKVVLVTGAGGSIGSELARQIAHFNPRQLILLDRAESPLYFTQIEIQRTNPAIEVIPVLASVTNTDRLERVFARYHPDSVFHAAAYKHVPMLEANVVEGVWNNVIGTLRLARCAARAGTSKMVFISTDKAVNPASILGATKRIAERVVLELPSLRASGTDFRVVRFGNVLGSDGSVVPLFKKQLALGGPITVTHPEVRRYFMTIPEAVQLVLQAAALPECENRISLLEMGTQMRIVDLAEQLIRLAGLVPHEDVKIVFTGLRPGEKLEEELSAPNEIVQTTTIDKIRVLERDPSHETELAGRLRNLIQAALRRDEVSLLRALVPLVPEYQPAAIEAAQTWAPGVRTGAQNRRPPAARLPRRTLVHGEARVAATLRRPANGNGRPHANGNGQPHTNGNGNGNGHPHSGGPANGTNGPAVRRAGTRLI